MITTVIGSYPISIDTMDLMKHYFNREGISWKPYIREAVEDMVKAGIKLVSDGQTRDPFTNIFLRKLRGCRVRDRVEVIDEISYIEPITLEDIRYAKSLLPGGYKILGLIVGPHTLSEYVVDNYYNDKKELAFAFAKAMREEAMVLQDIVDMISIDEPSLSTSYPSYARELIEVVSRDIEIPTRMHVCGDVSSVASELVDMPVDILSHEFKATPKLFDIFKEYPSRIGFCIGSIRADDPKVETIDEIVRHIGKAITIFGENIKQIAPDCGLRYLPRGNAFQKLRNLVTATEVVYGRV